MDYLKNYLLNIDQNEIDPEVVGFFAMLDSTYAKDPSVAESILSEFKDQRKYLKLIASENYSSLAVQMTQANLLTDKYSEGYPGHRFYAGCENVDDIESHACNLACDLFGAEHAYVQPHSGADANLVAFYSILSAKIISKELEKRNLKNVNELDKDSWNSIRELISKQKLLGLGLYSGGHLTHGYRMNISGLIFDAYSYEVDSETHLIDLDDLRKKAHEIKPLILLAGYSAYSRKINFAKMREIADEVGAVFMVDMAHFAGLVAGGVFEGDYNPVPHADIVTSTTHKTLRGPRGGLVLCKKEFSEFVDKGCPSVLGGPLPHVIAAKAIAFKEASSKDFKTYSRKIVDNANDLANALLEEGMDVITGGTDNHLLLLDVFQKTKLTGRQAESVLRESMITLNRNAIPNDENGPWYTSGLRIGTPAITTLGMGKNEMREIASIIKYVLTNTSPLEGKKSKFTIDNQILSQAKDRVQNLLSDFVLYKKINL